MSKPKFIKQEKSSNNTVMVKYMRNKFADGVGTRIISEKVLFLGFSPRNRNFHSEILPLLFTTSCLSTQCPAENFHLDLLNELNTYAFCS